MSGEPREPRPRARRALAGWLGASLLVLASRTASSEPLPTDRPGTALVVITAAGLAPARQRVPPATPIVWLNRAPQAAVAISFDDAFAESIEDCEARRGFHAVPGHGPFTMLLVPGSVVVLCAPSHPGSYGYAVHGEAAFEGVVEVAGDEPAAEATAP